MLALGQAACDVAPPPADTALTLAGEAIPYRAFEEFVEHQADESGPAMSSAVLSSLFDQFVERRLLDRWARDEGWTNDGLEPVDALLEGLEIPSPTPEQVRAVYEASPERFDKPLSVRLRQLLVEDEATADRALGQLRAGADFATVAEHLAASARGGEGGLEGLVSRADVPQAFVPVIFALGEGEFSDVVPAEYGFHIFQVVERFPERRLSLDEATPEIRRELERLAADREIDALVMRAVERYNLRLHPRNLPFLYRGRFDLAPSASDSS